MAKSRFDKRRDSDDEERVTKDQLRQDHTRKKNKRMRNALRTCDVDELMELEEEDF